MKLTLTITFDTVTKSTAVEGPIDDVIVSYGMLEAARDAIQKHQEQKRTGVAIAPAGTFDQDMRR